MTTVSVPWYSDSILPSVGVFWLLGRGKGVKPSWLAYRCPPNLVEPYGDCLTCPHGHYDLWNDWGGDVEALEANSVFGLTSSILEIVRATEYDDWPRGRVVREFEQTVVYADVQLLTSERRDYVSKLFKLDAQRTRFAPDAHYARARIV